MLHSTRVHYATQELDFIYILNSSDNNLVCDDQSVSPNMYSQPVYKTAKSDGLGKFLKIKKVFNTIFFILLSQIIIGKQVLIQELFRCLCAKLFSKELRYGNTFIFCNGNISFVATLQQQLELIAISPSSWQ